LYLREAARITADHRRITHEGCTFVAQLPCILVEDLAWGRRDRTRRPRLGPSRRLAGCGVTRGAAVLVGADVAVSGHGVLLGTGRLVADGIAVGDTVGLIVGTVAVGVILGTVVADGMAVGDTVGVDVAVVLGGPAVLDEDAVAVGSGGNVVADGPLGAPVADGRPTTVAVAASHDRLKIAVGVGGVSRFRGTV